MFFGFFSLTFKMNKDKLSISCKLQLFEIYIPLARLNIYIFYTICPKNMHGGNQTCEYTGTEDQVQKNKIRGHLS